MTYVRGLDGLRALAVIVVLLFHAEVPFVDGGFLGVSLFFTLSGFLITTLLLAEHDATGGISFRRFYGRRVRRLLPAAYACLILVAAWAVWWSAAQQRSLRGDLLASVANVANWRFAFATRSYQELFLSSPSPVAHFWSLAIEEQIYLILPIVALIALRRGRRVLAATTAALLGASLLATLMTSDRDLVYNGTHTRAGELLVGVALAQLLFSRRSGDRVHTRFDSIPGGLALVAFGGLVVGASLEQQWLYRGGFLVVALVSAILVHAVCGGRFPARLLEVRPLVAIGAMSYGIYLYHWPVFLLLDADRTGLHGVGLFGVRIAVTATLTVASYRLLEQPVRLGRVVSRDRAMALAFGALAVTIAGMAWWVRGPAPTATEQLLSSGEQSMIEFAPPLDGRGVVLPAVADASPAVTEPEALPRVLVLGSERSALDVLSTMSAEVIDGLRSQQPISSATAPGGIPLAGWFERLVDRQDPDVVVIAIGVAEDADAVGQLPIVGAEWKAAEREVLAALDQAVELGLPVIFYYPAPPPAPFDAHLDRLALMRPWLEPAARSGDELVAAVGDALGGLTDRRVVDGQEDEAVRVMVIGDSTSINMAKALNDGADGRLAVMWAGANGCPLVAVDGIRVSSEVDWSTPVCEAYETKLPPLVDRFGPDVVLLVLGPTELAEQRYVGDPAGHAAGDLEFAGAHLAAMEALLAVLDPSIPVLVADVPAVAPGYYVTRQMADPDRLEDLNALVESADRRWAQVELFDYRSTIESTEQTFGSIRSDGVHPDAAPLENMARGVFVGQLIDQLQSWRAMSASSG